MLRVAGSLTLGEVRGHDLIRMLQGADRLAGCRLAQSLRGGRGPLPESARLDAGALDRLGEIGAESVPADLMPGG
ncbi:hypothetical protein [Streptomyces clavifer]